MRIFRHFATLVAVGGLLPATLGYAQDTPAAACAGLNGPENTVKFAQIVDAPTTIISVSVVPADGDLPEICNVEGQISPTIGFELRLPTKTWNGKLIFGGCGGPCGQIIHNRYDTALVRNYAVVVTDMGHKGEGWAWAHNNLQGQIDFGYRSTHVTAVASRVITEAYYGKKASRNYFWGCSTGGRQAMVAAQRFPGNFEGIVAGAPVWNQTANNPFFGQWGARINLDKDRKPILDAKKLPMIHKSVLDACDGMDGLKDGILQDPRRCTWKPGQLQCKGAPSDNCLTKDEIDVVRRINEGPMDADGQPVFWGMLPGSEDQWTPAWINTDGKPGTAAGGPGFVVNSMLAYVSFFWPVGPSYTSFDFDYENDPPRLALKESIFNAQNPDLRKFKHRGGKLILYTGWNDNNIPPGAAVDYYETATRTMGGEAATKDFFRLFLLPAVNHCQYGFGGGEADWVGALESWVENGQAPEQITVYHMLREPYVEPSPSGPKQRTPRHPLDPSSYDRSRPVYAYPDVARYSGRGDANLPASWTKERR